MKQWELVEQQLPVLKTHNQKSYLAIRIRNITLIIMLLSLSKLRRQIIHQPNFNSNNRWLISIAVEHLLNIISLVYNTSKCNTQKEPIEIFFLAHLQHIFYFTRYSLSKAFLAKYINCIATFVWTYMDLFVIIVSAGLTYRFNQINDSLMQIKGKVKISNIYFVKNKQRVNEIFSNRIYQIAFGLNIVHIIEIFVNCVQQ